ncbi:hypothetical protein A2W45_04100 [Candidatus Curtissbacteria bacterium RIFCSPHIGHO2_12_41_11]|uniref:Uncharacterized protein n=2 Tax=Candidatus Curtissiibacteriota TaxID=1752717 RepID=A0A1F5H5I2_9BACT|nr:MAG: hypothetical protein A3D07_03910 [Candidatus Curtissbacteria bacterium RIFCSPHIGHO2_02_FULL_42_15]OGD99426.1 MAG: hypothetical protein A2W45_04100 [Candidatus Curtissbacteria bacterium RIFCSPHIGHO2_12_41_11]
MKQQFYDQVHKDLNFRVKEKEGIPIYVWVAFAILLMLVLIIKFHLGVLGGLLLLVLMGFMGIIGKNDGYKDGYMDGAGDVGNRCNYKIDLDK